MKAYTDLVQSKKLAEILPLESADIILTLEGNSELTSHPIMRNYSEFYNYLRRFELEEKYIKHMYIPAWSLAALLSVLPKSALFIPNPFDDGYCCKNLENDIEVHDSNPIDACYEIILKLHELKML